MSTSTSIDTTPSVASSYRAKYNLSPPNFDVKKPGDLGTWLERLRLYFVLRNEQSDRVKVSVLRSLLNDPMLERVDRLTPKTLKDCSYQDMVAALRSAFGVPRPTLLADRLATFDLRPVFGSTQTDWYLAVDAQTEKFDFERFTFDDLQVFVYLIGLADPRLRALLSSALRDGPLTLAQAHSLCTEASRTGEHTDEVPDSPVSIDRSASIDPIVDEQQSEKHQQQSLALRPKRRTGYENINQYYESIGTMLFIIFVITVLMLLFGFAVMESKRRMLHR